MKGPTPLGSLSRTRFSDVNRHRSRRDRDSLLRPANRTTLGQADGAVAVIADEPADDSLISFKGCFFGIFWADILYGRPFSRAIGEHGGRWPQGSSLHGYPRSMTWYQRPDSLSWWRANILRHLPENDEELSAFGGWSAGMKSSTFDQRHGIPTLWRGPRNEGRCPFRDGPTSVPCAHPNRGNSARSPDQRYACGQWRTGQSHR